MKPTHKIHALIFPAAILLASFAVLIAISPDRDQRLMFAMMVSGFVVLLSGWMLLDTYLDRLTMAAQGFEEGKKAINDRIDRLSGEISQVRSIPAIRRYLVAEAERAAREAIGGSDTDPDDPKMPVFNP